MFEQFKLGHHLSFRLLGGYVWVLLGILGSGAREFCFFQYKMCGEFVVNSWFLCGFCWWETATTRTGVNVPSGAVWSD